jgi:uncharacterized membrane protein (DUF2068 family)
MAKTQAARKRDHWLLLIGTAKCLKGIVLLLLALGALKLFHKDAASALKHWIEVIHVDPNNHLFARLIQKVGALEEHKKLLMAVGTFVYSGLFLTEGVGLLLQQQWAEYFAAVITGSFLPLEIYELAKHFSAAKVVVIILNAAVVAYLVWKLKHEHHKDKQR